jgi:hypothetical protein
VVPGIGGGHVQSIADLSGSDNLSGLDVFQDALAGGRHNISLSL